MPLGAGNQTHEGQEMITKDGIIPQMIAIIGTPRIPSRKNVNTGKGYHRDRSRDKRAFVGLVAYKFVNRF